MKNKLLVFLKNSLFILTLILLIVGSVEIILRLLGYSSSSSIITYDKDCYWRMAPKQKFQFTNEFGVVSTVSINSLGARGPEFSFHKPQGEKRIICVGDSYTFGLGVGDKETFPAYLQDFINKDYSNVKVINFGCNGHTILHEVNLIKKYGLRLKPDYVIVASSINTDFNEIIELKYNLGYMPTPGYNFIKLCIRKTAIGNILLKRWNSKKVKDILRKRNELQLKSKKSASKKINLRLNFVEKAYASESIQTPLDIYINKFDELVKLARENNFQIIYVIMPWGLTSLSKAKIDKAYCNNREITAYDFFEMLKNRYGKEVILIELMSYFNFKDLFLTDGHLNTKGNKLAATIIYKEIKKTL